MEIIKSELEQQPTISVNELYENYSVLFFLIFRIKALVVIFLYLLSSSMKNMFEAIKKI
jgi:hypothetical protein